MHIIRQLQRKIENLKNLTTQVQDVESEKSTLETENTRLKRQVESLRKQSLKLTEVEKQKLDLEKSVSRLQRTVDNVNKNRKQSDKMEVQQFIEISVLVCSLFKYHLMSRLE